jgi:Papain family cysteine protease
MSSVDWRNRFSANWISSVRDQDGTSNCWAFAMTALYEAVVRIEHGDWCRRSEGEASRGAGKQWWDIGNFGEVSNFVEKFGLSDPDCFPWTLHAALLTAKHAGSVPFVPLSPTPDRLGRTVKAPAVTSITKLADKKDWLQNVGPMAVMFNPPADFGSLGTGIYVPATTVIGAAHAVLVVGFDDAQQFWIVKNSWSGTAWGDRGFGRIAYSANLLEPLTFTGVRGTNVDPFTKRRSSNGAMVRSGNGSGRNNYELFILRDNYVEHWYRENGASGLPWNRVGLVRSTDPYRSFNDKPLDRPVAIQSTFNRNFEVLYRSDSGGIRHTYYDQAAGMWTDGSTFGPSDARGVPAFIQSNRGAPGDFEVVVQNSSGEVEHWTKHNSVPWTRQPGEWYLQQTFGGGVLIGGSLVQSRIGVAGEIEGGAGELHYVCVGAYQEVQHWTKPSPDTGSWSKVGSFGINRVTSAPIMIEGVFGMHDERGVGNFELCVGVNSSVEHWWRDNSSGAAAQWRQSAVFGTNVARVLALLQGPFGFNLELIVQRWDGRIQHYWRDGGGWHAGVIIV